MGFVRRFSVTALQVGRSVVKLSVLASPLPGSFVTQLADLPASQPPRGAFSLPVCLLRWRAAGTWRRGSLLGCCVSAAFEFWGFRFVNLQQQPRQAWDLLKRRPPRTRALN